MGTKIENALYLNPETGNYETIYYKSLDTDLYEEKYKGRLTCINGCIAKIKFTERKNNTRFFSTWNGDGEKHEDDCQYHVKYKGKIGRKLLKAKFTSDDLTSERIVETINRKIKSLKELHKEVIKTIPKGTKKVVNAGVETEETRLYIKSLDAKYLDPSYINTTKCVFGKINNIQIETSKTGEKYAYLNLDNTNYNVSVYITQAFYSNENNSLREFENYISILKNTLMSGTELLFIGVGSISRKKGGKGINVNILNKEHMIINETGYDEVIIKGMVPSSSIVI